MKITDYGHWLLVDLCVGESYNARDKSFATRDIELYKNDDFLNNARSDGYDAIWLCEKMHGKSISFPGWFKIRLQQTNNGYS